LHSLEPLGLFTGGSFICEKQTYYQKNALVERPGQGMVEVIQRIPHDSITQSHNLTMEITCLVWACVLLNIVYRFVDKGIASHGACPFHIP
jgi:hypothetical protein